MEKEPVKGEVAQEDVDELLAILRGYEPIYDLLSQEFQDEWGKVEAEAIGAEIDATFDKKEVAANLKKFLETLKEKIKNEAN